ncbi:MAG: ergothioneine biosynthesis protein EgtB [Bacteroidota bacterium]
MNNAIVASPTTLQKLAQRYREIRQQSLDLCAPLSTEDFVVQPINDVSPPKWHLGHTTWFFENFILATYAKDYQLYQPKYNYFFNSYYESQGPRILRSSRGNMTRPSVQDVMKYRQHVDEQLLQMIEHFEGNASELEHLLEVGLQHEQQHQELLVTDIKYILGNNPLYPPYQELMIDMRYREVRPMNFQKFEEGVYEIGYDGDDFCWDNEQSRHKTYLHEFEIADRLVTNGEYMEFMQAGGYENFEHWLMEGIEWARSLEVSAPLYWYEKEGKWYHYTLHGLEKVNPNEPITHISYYEADAYARWKGCRLPTEFEWEAACSKRYKTIPEDANFVETMQFHPSITEQKDDFQMLGQVWEWTASAYLPYPNYPRFKGALGEYNGKFMVNQMVLRGGSCATPISHIRPTYRNFFHADKRWQFTGIRLAK